MLMDEKIRAVATSLIILITIPIIFRLIVELSPLYWTHIILGK